MSAGAYGGKVTGAGGGGFLLILASPEKQKSVIKAMDNMPKVDFKFENYGSTIIYSQN